MDWRAIGQQRAPLGKVPSRREVRLARRPRFVRGRGIASTKHFRARPGHRRPLAPGDAGTPWRCRCSIPFPTGQRAHLQFT